MIGWDIFDVSSEIAKQNSSELDRKQDLNVLYQVCVFHANKKTMATLASNCLDIFHFSSETAEQNSTKLDRKEDLTFLYQVCVFRADRKKKTAALASDWLKLSFEFSSETVERNSTKLDSKQDLNVFYLVCVFQGLANLSRRWHIVLRCSICGHLGLLFLSRTQMWNLMIFSAPAL